MLEITLAHRLSLRSLAHTINPTVIVSKKGLSENIIKELDQRLRNHELIKIRVLIDDRGTREVLFTEICESLMAAPIQHIGKILIIYRLKPEETKNLAKNKFFKKRELRRTKRSFQS